MQTRYVRFILRGGLGNQLFQIAAACFFVQATNHKVLLVNQAPSIMGLRRISDLGTLSKRSISFSRSRGWPFRKLKARAGVIIRGAGHQVSKTHPRIAKLVHQYRPSGVGFDANLTLTKPGCTVIGYFQTWRYYEAIRSQLPSGAFHPSTPSKWYSVMQAKIAGVEVLAVHVRRGDYLTEGEIGALGASYYQKALAKMRSLGATWDEVWIFSDDRIIAEKLIGGHFSGKPPFYVDAPSSSPDFESMLLMSQAKNIIIANSTFSWWAAMLGPTDKKVVCPEPWFKANENPVDLFPTHWIPVGADWEY